MDLPVHAGRAAGNVSCHTETRRALELLQPRDVPKIAAAPLPNGPWNVRNFGWSPLVEGDAAGTVSRRTAAETKAVVDFINAKLLPKNVADSR
jgi:hypothetical protein